MFNSAFSKLIEQFSSLPGIGEKSAQRLAFFAIKQGEEYQKQFGNTFLELQEGIHYCPNCFNFSEGDLCDICKSEKRNKEQICIVETVFDIIALEKTHIYSGNYHVLQGTLSPLDGIGPKDLKIDELIVRLEKQPVEEIIFALNSTLEGEATANYIKKLLPEDIKITHLSRGIPSGASLEYADEITLSRALQDRR